MLLRRQPSVEKVKLSGMASLVAKATEGALFDYPWHEHPEYELTWIGRGSGTRLVGDSIEPFHQGDLCLLPGGLPHVWMSPRPASAEGVSSIVVQFDPARWGDAFLRLPDLRGVRLLLERCSRGLHFAGAPAADVAVRLQRELVPERSDLRRFTLLLELLDRLGADRQARPLALKVWRAGETTRPDSRVGTTLAYLQGHYTGPVVQAEAARRAGLSPAAFSRFFRRAVGRTFVAYVNGLRLGEACRLLMETDRTITEIAFAVGFSNLSNFNRCFRAARGMSPRDYRRRALSPSG